MLVYDINHTKQYFNTLKGAPMTSNKMGPKKCTIKRNT